MTGAREIRPKILKSDDPLLTCMENDAKTLSNWIKQAVHGCNYSTDLIRPRSSTLLDCIKADAQSILNHVKECEEKGYLVL